MRELLILSVILTAVAVALLFLVTNLLKVVPLGGGAQLLGLVTFQLSYPVIICRARLLSIGRGVDPDRISVVMNSADGRLFDPSRYPRRPFMADGTLRLIHHSNFQRIYGLDVAIEGLSRVRSDLPWRLDVYGDGPWRPAIEAAIERTGTADRVTLHGRAEMDELPAILAGSDIGLVPSLPEPYLEYSLSTKLLEYAAMAVPTIASDLATFRHYFDDAALRFVPGGDPDALARAVEAMADDPAGTVATALRAARRVSASRRRST